MSFNEPNPMLLPNIVSNVLRHIPDTSTLEKLRLVCSCWNQEACILLRKLKIIELSTTQSLQSYTSTFHPTHEVFGAFPHAKYKLSLKIDPAKSTDSNFQQVLLESLDQFIDHFGSFIICCHLPVRSIYFEAWFFDMVLGKLPNITTLGVHIQYYYQQTLPLQFSPATIINLQRVHSLIIQIEGLELSEEKTTDLLSSLFLYLPNLQRISCPGDIRRISKTGLLLRDIILESDTSDNLTKLRDWDFKIRLLEEHCLKLLCKEFPMRSLFVDLYNPEDDHDIVTSDVVAGVLRKWTATLQHLEIEFPFRKEISFHFHFPAVMENVQILYLGGFEGCLLELLRKLPMLRKLDLSQLELMSILPKPDEMDSFQNVKHLRLDFCMGQTAGILSRFSRIFPQLQNLNINHTTNEVARMIFQKMGNLCTLTIEGNDLTDAGMCGFSEYSTKENDFLAISSARGNSFRKHPYIADLKELRYLNLDAFALTEITVRHGLVHCRSLRLVKMDCTAGERESSTVSRKFRLSEYGNHLVEEGQPGGQGMIEMKEEPPMEDEALAFFQSHDKYSDDLVNP